MNAVPEKNENNAVEFNPPKVDPAPKVKTIISNARKLVMERCSLLKM